VGFPQPRLRTYPTENFPSLGDFGSFRIGLSVRPAGLDRVKGRGAAGACGSTGGMVPFTQVIQIIGQKRKLLPAYRR
jgi:hypothetical protein